jgi:hypothetical protein
MKNFSIAALLSTLFCLLAFTHANAQITASTNNSPKAKISFNLKPNMLYKDGKKVEITESSAKESIDKAKDGVEYVRGIFKPKKAAKQEDTAVKGTTTTANTDKVEVASTTPATPNMQRTVLPITTPTTTPAANYNGDWKMAVTIKEKLSNNGQRSDAPGACEIGMNLKIEGQSISGEYTWAKGACGIASIAGVMTGANTFEAVITYKGGSCNGSKMKFTGSFLSADTVTGKFKPEGFPGAGCDTWWATVQGEKE